MGSVTWPQIVTAVVGVLALAVTLYNAYLQYTASKGGVRFVASKFEWEDSTPEQLSYTLLIHGFNQRDTYTGARNIYVKFFKEGEEVVRTRLRDVVDDYYADFLNFPPNQWVAKMYRGVIAVDAAGYDGPKPEERYNEARLVIELPHAASETRVRLDGGEVEKTVGGLRRSQEEEEWARTAMSWPAR